MSSRLKIWYLAVLLFLLCFVGLASSCSGTGGPGRALARPDVEALKRMTAFVGGKFDASGVVAVTGSEGFLFVDNNQEGQVFWMRLDQYGKQVGAINAVELGVSIDDLEGITTDGTYFYVVSSQSKSKANDTAGLVRFKFDAQRQHVEAAESISGLKRFLLENGAWSSTHLIGIDMEDQTRNLEAAELAQQFFRKPSRRLLKGISGPARLRTFFQLWSLKEAALNSSAKRCLSASTRLNSSWPRTYGSFMRPVTMASRSDLAFT